MLVHEVHVMRWQWQAAWLHASGKNTNNTNKQPNRSIEPLKSPSANSIQVSIWLIWMESLGQLWRFEWNIMLILTILHIQQCWRSHRSIGGDDGSLELDSILCLFVCLVVWVVGVVLLVFIQSQFAHKKMKIKTKTKPCIACH